MCWNVEFSLFSAVVGWIACAILLKRNHSPRDKWYATYLVTYTFTQLIDIALWSIHEDTPLQGCPDLKQSFSNSPTAMQMQQFLISKYLVPLVTLSQFCIQLNYPSPLLKGSRKLLVALHALPCLGMAFEFACSDIVQSAFPVAHATIRWGGHTAEEWQTLLVVAMVLGDFYATSNSPALEACRPLPL